MSIIEIAADDRSVTVTVVRGTDADGEAWTTATCPVHGDLDGDHSHFGYMVQVAEVHVDHVMHPAVTS